MGSFVLTSVRLFAGGANLSGHSNSVELTPEVEDKDVTNYESGGWTELLGGLASAEISAEGQWEAGDPSLVDDASWAQLGGTGAWTIGPDGAAAGDLAYLTKALRSEYKIGDAVGEVAPWSATAKSSWPVVRGVFEHSPGTPVTTSGATAGVQLGAVSAGQRLYAALHVLSVAGTGSPTISVGIESDDTGAFASPTARHGFDVTGDWGGQVLRTSGSVIADTWWRATYTLTGTSPSFLFALALGIR